MPRRLIFLSRADPILKAVPVPNRHAGLSDSFVGAENAA